MGLVELKNLLLHFFVLIWCEGQLTNEVQRARLVRFIVANFCLLKKKKEEEEQKKKKNLCTNWLFPKKTVTYPPAAHHTLVHVNADK